MASLPDSYALLYSHKSHYCTIGFLKRWNGAQSTPGHLCLPVPGCRSALDRHTTTQPSRTQASAPSCRPRKSQCDCRRRATVSTRRRPHTSTGQSPQQSPTTPPPITPHNRVQEKGPCQTVSHHPSRNIPRPPTHTHPPPAARLPMTDHPPNTTLGNSSSQDAANPPLR